MLLISVSQYPNRLNIVLVIELVIELYWWLKLCKMVKSPVNEWNVSVEKFSCKK